MTLFFRRISKIALQDNFLFLHLCLADNGWFNSFGDLLSLFKFSIIKINAGEGLEWVPKLLILNFRVAVINSLCNIMCCYISFRLLMIARLLWGYQDLDLRDIYTL